MALVALMLAGCSLSDSSESISKSISSPSESSSKSSSADRDDYEEDVRDYTAGFVRSGGEATDFRAGLSKVASRHKISNWESDDSTFIGIGKGLRKAEASEATVEGFKASVAGGSEKAADAIDRGYSGK